MEDGQEQRESSQAELARLHPMTPLKELPEEEEEEDESSAGGDNNNSILGKMKKRVSSIFPTSISGWFSPSSKGGPESAASSSSANLRQPQPRQANGRSTTKRKRGRRRIMLADADEADDLDDGTDANGLNYEEVALADNIAEHDLAAEDEQTRRSEYNVFLLRKRRDAVAAAGGDDEEAEDDDLEDEEDEGDEEDDDDEQDNLLQSTAVPKRRRLELETTVNLPNMRRLPLLSSTPAAPLVGSSSNSSSLFLLEGVTSSRQIAPHRRNHLNLYGSQRQREPAYNFFTGNEAAEGSTGDLPHSIRRSLNIPFGGSSTATRHNSLSSLPNHKRPSLMGQRTHRQDLTMDETGIGLGLGSVTNTDGDRLDHLLRISKTNNNISNNNNNNNNVIKSKSRRTELSVTGGVGGDSQSESDMNDYHDNGDGHDGLRPSHHSSNSNLEFYGNLQSTKSIFNRSNATAQQSHRNSTWSLNSLNQRRRFNASIYGSTSALSDSRLLSRSASASGSASASSSPFYQGRTTFGGNSANNRIFSRSNLSSSAASSTMAINSAGSSPAHPLQGSMAGGIGYGMKAVDMQPSVNSNISDIGGIKKSGSGLSNTTLRILSLLDSYSTPLIDAKRMGSTIKEHQSSRQQRQSTSATPYPRPSGSISRNTTVPKVMDELAEMRSNKLLVPTMQQLLERRRLHRVTQNSREVVHQNARSGTENNQEKVNQTTPYVAPVDQSSSHTPHTNKMRSRLSHQQRNKEPRTELEEAPKPLDLPQISFPDMASTPKFDLVIKPSVPVVSKPSSVIPIISNKSNNSNIAANSKQLPNFLANPQPAEPIVNFSANGNTVVASSKPSGRNFNFSEPIALSNSQVDSVSDLAVKRNYFFPSPASLDDVPKPSQPTMNGAPPLGFGEQFKKSSKEWECDVCMIRNKAEVNKCVACETAKPGATPPMAALVQAAPPTTAIVPLSGFGDRFKKSSTAWECDACMLSNKAEASKCIACETPRKAAAPKVNNFPQITNNSITGSGFGNAFKPKANTWECQTCLVMNKSSVTECIACQTPNSQPKSNSDVSVRSPSGSSSSSTSSSGSLSGSSSGSLSGSSAAPSQARSSGASSSSIIGSSTDKFKFGYGLGSSNEVPKQDTGFQQLVAAQKAASWDCDACMAQNDMSRIKCICCEQLKPGATGVTSLSTSTTTFGSSGSTISSASAVPKFSFGFATVKEVVKPSVETAAQGKDVADSKKSGEPIPSFSFGVSKVDLPKTVSFTTETKAPAAASSTETTAPAAAPSLQFEFKAPTTATTAASSLTTTTTTTPALGGFRFSAPPSSSTVSSSTASSSANPTAVKPMFNFLVSSTSSQQPMAKVAATPSLGVSSNTITTTTTSTLTPTATPAAAVTTSAPAPAANFSFGSQAKPAATQNAGTFFFGQTAASSANPVSTSVSSIFGAPVNTTANTSSSLSVTTSTTNAVVPSFEPTTTPQLFGSWGEKKAVTTTSSTIEPFAFGSSSGPGTTATPSFGWSNNGATAAKSNSIAVTSVGISAAPASTMPTAVFGSSSMFGAPSNSTTSTSSSLFGLTATSPAAATPAAGSLGGNGAISGVFGNMGNSLAATGAPTATMPAVSAAAPLANIFGNPTTIAAAAPVFGSSSTSGGFGAAAASATAATSGSKVAFAFGGATAAAPASSNALFKFGSANNDQPTAKPAFNFTASAVSSTPNAQSFNFTSNSAATSLSGGDSQPRIFQFGSPLAAVNNQASGPGGLNSSSSSGGMPMLNFTATSPQMQSTPNANAPFPFSAGSPAPANIFAFNPPASGNSAQNSQTARRKIRSAVRRQPPR
ncbi:nuclear pore complex protein Nup153 isoform X2 [Drosophila eugracilis]|uniref:nuclear pore complex protein Nup153 isoform X2 n=1 Tax=Drosophila eugracilis TaxID=29029 RepID=UPI0007E7A867|nr:nuclear pore complex protein Nup153 isoform X2 [Drosophila eugracilis]